MSEEVRHLQLPLAEGVARSLSLGAIVTVSGRLFTGRSLFHIRAIEESTYPPLDYARINCFLHAGPVVRRIGHRWQAVSIEPTSSIRFERYAAEVVRKFGLRTVVGKTTVGSRTATALAEVGGVYLSKIGLCGNRLRRQVRAVEGVHFLDALGSTEATWVFDVCRFGPFFVAVDSQGDNYFDALAAESGARLREAEASLGVPADYRYTQVGPE